MRYKFYAMNTETFEHVSRIIHINYMICDSIHISMLLMLRVLLDLCYMFRVHERMGCNLISCTAARANRDYTTGCSSQTFWFRILLGQSSQLAPYNCVADSNYFVTFIVQITTFYQIDIILANGTQFDFVPARDTTNSTVSDRTSKGYCSLIFNFKSDESAQVRWNWNFIVCGQIAYWRSLPAMRELRDTRCKRRVPGAAATLLR